MKNLIRDEIAKGTTNKVWIILAAPIFLFGGLFAYWLLLLMIGLFMKVVFGLGNLTTVNGEAIWQWKIHFFPYGLFISAGTALITWLVWKRNYKK